MLIAYVCLNTIFQHVTKNWSFEVMTYPIIKDHLGFTVANKFICVLWVKGDIHLL